MSTISDVKEMQQQGLSESQIIQKLKEQGISPLEISQSLEQSKIKSAVDNEENMYPGMYPQPENNVMQQSVMTQPAEEPVQQSAPQEYYQYQQQAPQYQEYPQQQYQEYQQYQGNDSVSEIAEQVAEEKINTLKKSIGNIDELKTLISKRVENIDDRLKKIETTIEKLQSSILGKVIGYGQSMDEIKDEMKMMQESFSKALNPLIDKGREAEKKQHRPEPKSKKPGIEHFLRR